MAPDTIAGCTHSAQYLSGRQFVVGFTGFAGTPKSRERRSVPFPAALADELAALMIGALEVLAAQRLIRLSAGEPMFLRARPKGFEPSTF